jgi:DNA polymerase I-like protein with 3'-5' exonuclease and polymerase domains
VPHNLVVRIALVAGPGRSALLCPLDTDGGLAGSPQAVPDLVAAVAEREKADRARWVWQSAARLYPALLRSGVRVARCHDAELTEALLAGRDASAAGSAPQTAAAATPRPGPGAPDWQSTDAQQLPFGMPEAAGTAQAALSALTELHASQLARLAADDHPARFRLLATAESAGALVAAEMTAAGLPWRSDVHDQLLTELLGPRPPGSGQRQQRPARLTELAEQITAALGAVRPVNPDSPAQLLRALSASGIRVPSTRTSALRNVDHPVIPLLLRYKELARLHAANGWAWLDTWVKDGRFRPEYVVGGVVSGRWASRGGGALQIPRLLRKAVVADPGWTLVVSDAAQLEPRVLAALAGDQAFAATAATGDIYAAVAAALGSDRRTAKVALLSAMYGGTGGAGGQSLTLLRRRFPRAFAFVEDAARSGERGGVVRSVLGRTCPPPSAAWREAIVAEPDADAATRQGGAATARARGRFTRNFVVQASAADWALVLLATLRAKLAGLGTDGRRPELVFFQHDEVVVHCPADMQAGVTQAISESAADATRLVFGATGVSFPMSTAVVEVYADAK